MKIIIETIPHCDHRYETVGDWYVDQDGNWRIKVSKMSDWRREILVAIHELTEMTLCANDGVDENAITEFDKAFEKERAEGMHSPSAEPGDDPDAPYRVQHFVATNIERTLARELNVNWEDYDNEVSSL